MLTLPHTLSPADSAQAEQLAARIHALAEPTNKLMLVRCGQALFQHQSLSVEEITDCTYLLYHFPGFGDYVRPFITDDARITAFENEVALRVYLITVRRVHRAFTFEVAHD